MSPEVIAILRVGVSLGVGLGGLIVSGQRALRAELDIAREERAAIRSDVAGIRQDLHAVDKRVARIEGVLPFLVERAKAAESAS